MKRQKKLKLLVDTIRHLSDHGLAVEFTDPQLNELVNSLKKDGITELKAGESSLKLVTVGRVTFTKLFLAHGSYTIRNVHYLDEGAGLKFTHKEGKDQYAFETLRGVILGRGLPSIWYARTGAAQDELRKWVKKWGWTLTGENGLRSMAIEAAKESVSNEISSIKHNITQNAYDLERFNSRDFAEEIAEKRRRAMQDIKHYRDRQNQCDEAYENLLKVPAEVDPQSSEVNSNSTLFTFGLKRIYERKDDGSYHYRYFYGGTGRSCSHPVILPNYTVQLSEDGQSVILSSGIKCDVTLQQFIQWMKGEGPAPITSYGPFSVVEGADQAMNPLKLIKCGCHLVDPSNLSEEVRELMKPTHQVTVIEGTPSLNWPEDREAILEMGRGKVARDKETYRKNIADRVAEYRRSRSELEAIMNNKEEHVAKHHACNARLETQLEETQAKAKALDAKFISSADCNDAVLTAVNALAGIKAE